MKILFKSETGFIALISAIIMAGILVVISVSLSQGGFFSRFNILESEYKARSMPLAQGCVNQALLNLAQGIKSSATGTVVIGYESCDIINIGYSSGQFTIQTKGVYERAVTNLQVVVNDWDFSLISWQELASL